MSDDKEKSNVIDLSAKRNKQQDNADPKVDDVICLSDDLDDVLNEYLEYGVAPDLVAAVLANRLGTLLSAMKEAGIDDPIEIYLDIVSREALNKTED